MVVVEGIIWNGYIQDFRIYKGTCKIYRTFTCGAVDSSVIEDSPSGIAIPRTLDSHTGGSVLYIPLLMFLLI